MTVQEAGPQGARRLGMGMYEQSVSQRRNAMRSYSKIQEPNLMLNRRQTPVFQNAVHFPYGPFVMGDAIGDDKIRNFASG